MIRPYLLRTAFLRTRIPNTTLLAQQCRYKSIYTAIDEGKARADSFSKPRRDRDRGRDDNRGGGKSYPSRYPRDRPEYEGLESGSGGEFRRQNLRQKFIAEGRTTRDKDSRILRPPRDFGGSRESRPPKDFGSKPSRDSGGWRETEPARDFNGSRESRPPRDFGDSKEGRPRRDFKVSRDESEKRPWEHHGNEPWKTRFSGESRPSRDLGKSNDSRPPRDLKGSRDSRESKNFGKFSDTRPPRDFNGSYASRESRPSRDFNGSRVAKPDREQQEWNPSKDHPKESFNFNTRDTDAAEAAGTNQHFIETLPYTTAASEFLYGFSTVLAAIKANTRKLYTLYIHTRGLKNEGVEPLLARAMALRLNVREVDDTYLRAMDKASSGRPHNGFILEASPLPQHPITEMGVSSLEQGFFKVGLDKQSAEAAAVNGSETTYNYKSAGWRHPLLLYVDGVLDEGNLGAIARSAYILGVDAIATPTRHSAPWSHIALKASAGAAEAIPIFTVAQPADFLGKSAREGWRIYASDAVPAEEPQAALTTPGTPTSENSSNLQSKVVYTFARSVRRMPYDHCPVATHPTILMMGAEGTGLRASLLNQAHYKVGIKHGRETDEVGVDSLNVSVAASLLCYEMLRKPKPAAKKPGELLF